MNYENLIASSLTLDIDYRKMSDELMKAKEFSVPFSYPADGSEVTAYSLFLRKNPTFEDYSYRGAKQADNDKWEWDDKLDIPYTRSVIDSLPYTILGTVRIVYFPNVPCVEHTDWDDSSDHKNTLGLSIIPDTGNTECYIWSEVYAKYLPLPGHAMLLNDSIKHKVPCSQGTRITIRIFGEIDYSWFDDKLNQQYCYYD